MDGIKLPNSNNALLIRWEDSVNTDYDGREKREREGERINYNNGCATCKHIANDGKYPCKICGDISPYDKFKHTKPIL